MTELIIFISYVANILLGRFFLKLSFRVNRNYEIRRMVGIVFLPLLGVIIPIISLVEEVLYRYRSNRPEGTWFDGKNW